jgi:hypothetical protein
MFSTQFSYQFGSLIIFIICAFLVLYVYYHYGNILLLQLSTKTYKKCGGGCGESFFSGQIPFCKKRLLFQFLSYF